MMRRSTPEIRERAIALREERGWTIARIARTLGYSPGGVAWWLLAAGAEKPGRRSAAPPRIGSRLRSGHVVHPFSAAEDVLLLQLEAANVSTTGIARGLTAAFPGRPRNRSSVIGRLRTLARRAERDLVRGQANTAAADAGERRPRDRSDVGAPA